MSWIVRRSASRICSAFRIRIGRSAFCILPSALRRARALRYAYASIGGQMQIRLRSPYGLSMRPTLGQNLLARTHGSG